MAFDPTLTLTRDGHRELLELPRLTASLQAPGAKASQTVLGLRPLVIGSGPDCDLIAPHSSVSRQHCELSLKAGGVLLKDLGSKNGTLINGVRVLEAWLPIGATVQLGLCTLSVEGASREQLEVPAETRFGDAVALSASMRLLFELLRRAAATDATVVLLGESGTGKELLARGLHETSPRKDGPFVVFDCGAVAPTLIEAELFGYVKGAFTGADAARKGLLESAHGGTLFLDEIGELPLELQARLLRALESRQVRPVGANAYRPFDTRVVAATHRDLQARVAAGTFRQDLYFRLAVVVAEVPPLRERREDIPALVELFLSRQTPPRTLQQLPTGMMALLTAHDWPGNVRELANTVTRLSVMPSLGKKAIEQSTLARPSNVSATLERVLHLPLREARELVVEDFEKEYLVARLEQHRDNVSAVAQSVGVSRQFLYRLLNRYGLKGAGSGE